MECFQISLVIFLYQEHKNTLQVIAFIYRNNSEYLIEYFGILTERHKTVLTAIIWAARSL